MASLTCLAWRSLRAFGRRSARVVLPISRGENASRENEERSCVAVFWARGFANVLLHFRPNRHKQAVQSYCRGCLTQAGFCSFLCCTHKTWADWTELYRMNSSNSSRSGKPAARVAIPPFQSDGRVLADVSTLTAPLRIGSSLSQSRPDTRRRWRRPPVVVHKRPPRCRAPTRCEGRSPAGFRCALTPAHAIAARLPVTGGRCDPRRPGCD